MRELIRVNEIMDAFKEEGIFVSGLTEAYRLNTPVDKALAFIDILPFLEKDVRKEKDGRIKIGAGATFSDLLENEDVPEYLKEALRYMRSPELRNQATIGGNVAAWRSDSYLIPALYAAGAELVVLTKSGAEKSIRIDSYSKEDIILSITVDAKVRVKNYRESITSHSHAIVTAAITDERECYAIKGSGIFFSLEKAEYVSDMHGSAEYKKYLATLYHREGKEA